MDHLKVLKALTIKMRLLLVQNLSCDKFPFHFNITSHALVSKQRLDGLKMKEISTYSCTFFSLQFPDALQEGLEKPPSTNIEDRNSAKTQSAVVFILLK